MKEIELTFNQTMAINQTGVLRRMLNDNTFIFTHQCLILIFCTTKYKNEQWIM